MIQEIYAWKMYLLQRFSITIINLIVFFVAFLFKQNLKKRNKKL